MERRKEIEEEVKVRGYRYESLWTGEIGEYSFVVEILNRPKKHCINGGRVKQLSIFGDEGITLADFSGGKWHTRPQTEEVARVVNKIVTSLEYMPKIDETLRSPCYYIAFE